MTKNSFQDLQYWEKKNFDIMVSQSLNLAVEVLTTTGNPFGQESRESLINGTKFFFGLLLELRNDPSFQRLYEEKRSSIELDEKPL